MYLEQSSCRDGVMQERHVDVDSFVPARCVLRTAYCALRTTQASHGFVKLMDVSTKHKEVEASLTLLAGNSTKT